MKKKHISFYSKDYKPNKTVLGARCQPDLVSQIDARAEKLGISRSAYAETLLLTAETNRIRMQRLESDLSRANYTIKRLETQLAHKRSMLEIYDEPRLLGLFDKLKGTTDVIKSSDGESITVRYNSPKDVLMAMVYSFKVKR